ncbi:MAG: hypothetical protein V7641_3547 [Blastocatellia bacterium]
MLLLVDDNDQMRQLIRSLVADLADNILECSDGAEAIVIYGEHQPDWVLMDIKMKQVDGLAATRQIKAAYPEAKIVIVTNFDDRKMREAACEAGAVEFVAKDNLLDVRHLLAKTRCAGP